MREEQTTNDELMNKFVNGISRAVKKGSARLEDYINKDNSAARKAFECAYSCNPSFGKRPASIYDYIGIPNGNYNSIMTGIPGAARRIKYLVENNEESKNAEL